MIEILFRVQCKPCERYLAPESYPYPVKGDTSGSPLFLTFSSAYDEAVRRGWGPYPLLCPDCTADLEDKALLNREDLQTSLQQLRNGQLEPATTLEEETRPVEVRGDTSFTFRVDLREAP